jgi:hypothetical protein
MSISSAKADDVHVKTVEEIGLDLNITDGERRQAEKKLVRRIDLRMMPLMMLICTSRRHIILKGCYTDSISRCFKLP